MQLPTDYLYWQDTAEGLLDALMAIAPSEGSEFPIRGLASDHDANADRLEAFARPCLLASLWLQSESPAKGDSSKAESIASWFRQALLKGTDPKSAYYWGPNTNFHQNGVEIGLLSCALLIGRQWLWDPFSEAERYQVGRWIASNRATGHVWNNHFFFGILALEFLKSVGMDRPADQVAIDTWFEEMEGMYRGNGWFMDGMNQSYDHYNAYAFHFYGLLWGHLFGDRNPERRDRWAAWATTFLDRYQHVFAASGEHPAFGRSITYRFNASAPFSLAELLGVSPLPKGRARRLCTRNLKFFMDKPITQEQGVIGVGWWDVFPDLAEKYTCAGSVYWASKAFSCLLLPPDHSFWTAEETPLACENEDIVSLQPEAGLVFRSIDGAVEILNAGTEITPVNMAKFGPWKWGKLAYRTGFGFQIGRQDEYYNKVAGYYSRDGGLTMEGGNDDRIHGRHYTETIELDQNHFGCTYALGDKVDQLTTIVETYVWWKEGWLLQVHWTDAYQPVVLNLGGYALADADPQRFKKADGALTCQARAGDRITAFQAVAGINRLFWDERLDDTRPRSHVQAPYHVTPVGHAGKAEGERTLIALVYAGSDPEAAAPWRIVTTKQGSWELAHGKLGTWAIEHPVLPDL